ncbi:MAG: helix-turn-helix transcriptional regulator [Chitinophagaceae bacterium]|nr:helix-turn-helix transcriptional regulator [Chitinophagaceae bacterium]
MNFFAKNIHFLRKRKKLVQNEMPELIGVSRVTWSNYENDHTQPDIDKLIDIADFFEISIDHLLKTNLSLPQNAHLLTNPYQSKPVEKNETNESAIAYEKEVDLLILKQLNNIADGVAEIKEKLA